MADQPTMRRATLGDVNTVARLTHDAYQHYVALLHREPQPMTTDWGAFVAQHPVWFLDVGEEVVGVLALQQEADALVVYSVAVHPAHQRRGWGRRLLRWAEDETRRAGLHTVRLYTNALMDRNIALYGSLGYQETGREAFGGGTVVHMAKTLDHASIPA